MSVVYSTDGYFVMRASYGFDIYRNGVTHATRCARIGYKGQEGLNKAKAEIKRRIEETNPKPEGE